MYTPHTAGVNGPVDFSLFEKASNAHIWCERASRHSSWSSGGVTGSTSKVNGINVVVRGRMLGIYTL